MASLNGIPIWSVRHKPSKIVYSDPSGSARGDFIKFEGKMFHHKTGQNLRKHKVLLTESCLLFFLIN